MSATGQLRRRTSPQKLMKIKKNAVEPDTKTFYRNILMEFLSPNSHHFQKTVGYMLMDSLFQIKQTLHTFSPYLL